MAITAVARRAAAHNAAGTSMSATVGSLTTGNFLVLVLSLATNVSTGTPAAPTDNGAGSAWQADVALASTSGSVNGIQVASTIIGATPPTSISVSWTAGSVQSGVQVFEFSGVAASSWLDVAGTPAAQSAGTTASATTITPAVAGELIIGAFAAGAAQSSFTAGSGYTSWGTPINTAPDVCAEYNLSGTTSETDGGTYGASVTTTARGVLVAYKAAVAPPVLVTARTNFLYLRKNR